MGVIRNKDLFPEIRSHYQTFLFGRLQTYEYNLMHEMSRPENALSETMSIIFMAILIVVAALLLVASLTGVITNLLQKPAFLSVQVVSYTTSDNAHIIDVFNKQGDSVNLNGTSQKEGSSIVSLILINNGDGTEYPVGAAGPILHDDWGPGDHVYIYRNGGMYVFSDAIPVGTAGSIPTGSYTVKIIDNKVQVLLGALPVTIP